MKTELRRIPGVGAKTEEDLIALGYTTIASLRGQDPEDIYARDCLRRGCPIDRCQLYVYRCAVYFAEHETPDPEKLNWWYWKDKPLREEISILPAVQKSQIQELCQVADEVWHEHYAGILSEGQIDYMVEKFQSPEAVRRQMKEEGYQYFLLRLGEETAGYCGIKVEEDRLFLSKLYLRQSCRGHGIARKVMEFLEDMCRRNLLRAIWLTVNKYNSGSIAAYEKMGFHKAYTQTTDIGSGYVMDDYIMEKPID